MKIDIGAIDIATRNLAVSGTSVLNGFLLETTERKHVSVLLDLMRPPVGAVVVDAGCGTGEVARLMEELRPDLRFKLVNISAYQLSMCPGWMEQIEADFDNMPLADESVDVVMFNFALCHSGDWIKTLVEARRVLRSNGVLFIYDMAREDGDNQLMRGALQAEAHYVSQGLDAVRRSGFHVEELLGHEPKVELLRDLMPGTYDDVVGKVFPVTWRATKEEIKDPIESAFARHTRIAFQFSGGRDSTAALYLLRPYWDRMAIYHLDTGDQFPETQEVVRKVEEDMGRPVIRIAGNVAKVREERGLASDIVPVDNTEIGRLVSGRELKIISRYECCYLSLMKPMQDRMVADGITLIVRGQRDDEYAKPPLRSGESGSGIEVLYPIQDWSADRVDGYLISEGHPIAPYYGRGMKRAPECMSCTAWWDEGRAKYLSDYHPEKVEGYMRNMIKIRIEIDRQYQTLEAHHAQI